MSRLLSVFSLSLFMLFSTVALADEHPSAKGPQNIILMIGDGMGPAHVKAYRVFADDPATHVIEPLVFDGFQVGAVATDSITEVCDDEDNCVFNPYGITDSAASATAYATGVDTINRRLGVDENGAPLTSVLEMAVTQGMRAGLISTSQITHATPAAFVAQVTARRDYVTIANQFVDRRVHGKPLAHLMLGGGVNDFVREDRDLTKEFSALGYDYVTDRDGLSSADELPLLGLFAPVGLPRHWDRPKSVPSLDDMTAKALELLPGNDEGFFLMVEGSQIDWAAHGEDIAGVISEMEDFHASAKRVLEFAASRGDTLVIITADHETGGLSLGRDHIYEWNPQALRNMTETPAVMMARYLAGKGSLSDIVARAVAFELTDEERAELDATEKDEMIVTAAITELLDLRTNTGWTTGGHTGVDVPLYATGPGSDKFRGVLQNEQLGQLLIESLPE